VEKFTSTIDHDAYFMKSSSHNLKHTVVIILKA